MAITTTAQRTAVTDLLAKVPAALTNNTTYLAVGSPSVAQNTLQIQRLTRQVNAVMKLLAGMYGDHAKLIVGTDT